MVKRKSPLEPSAGPRKRAYELPNMINVQVKPDPVRQIEDEAMRDLSNEYRQLRIEEMIAKKRAQLNKSSPSSDIDQQKQNLGLIEGIVKIAKELQPQAGKDQTLEYLKFFNTVTQGQAGRGGSFFESMVQDPALYQRTREIFGGGKLGATNPSDIEIEKLRGERMLDSKRIDLEIFKMRLEQEVNQGKIGMLGQILGPVLAAGGAQVAKTMQERGMEIGQNHRSRGNPASQNGFQGFLQEAGIVTPGSLQGETAKLQIMCDCGFSEALLVPVPPPPTVRCPNCGKVLETGPPPPLGDTETSEQWRQQA